MPITKSQQKAVAKYSKAHYDTVFVRIKKGSKSLIESAAREKNESINGYIKNALKARYEAETGNGIIV